MTDDVDLATGTRLPSLSALELGLVEDGRTASDALAAVGALATLAGELGFRRVWVAEHHGYRSRGTGIGSGPRAGGRVRACS